jgi:branched-subunit amino acid aminotransferase/4-amino-4-deoxychorismate lyase
VNGRLRDRCDPAIAADDVASLDGLGCYTTARIAGGVARWGDRHADRLQRDARALGLGEVDAGDVARAFRELGRAAFGEDEGIVRLQVGRVAGQLQLVGIPRWVGEEPATWTTASSPCPHPGRVPWGNAKLSGNPAIALIRRWTREQGVDEALIYDAEGYLIEGTRSNLFVVTRKGELWVPDLARGGVRGVARDAVLEAGASAGVRHISANDVKDCRELIAVNAVRGARPIVELDGRPVGDGRPGPCAAALDDILAKA